MNLNFAFYIFEGCYSDNLESLPDVVEMTLSSVGMCQEICHHKNIELFALKVGIGFGLDAA